MIHDNFVHLHTHSAYSLAEGAIPVKELVELCMKHKMPALAVTDTNNMFGALEFAIFAKKMGVQPIIGVQVAVGEERHQLVLLVQTELGYRNLCRLLSDAYMNGDPQRDVTIAPDKLKEFNAGLICLTGGSKGAIVQHLYHNQNETAQTELLFLKEVFSDRLYIELQRHGWIEERNTEDRLIDLAYKHDVPMVATNDCYFAKPDAYEAHDALLCIADGRYITEEDRRKVTPEHYFKAPREMGRLFADLPEAIINTGIVAQRCSYLLEPIEPILPAFDTQGGRSEFEELKFQSEEGLKWRVSQIRDMGARSEKDYFDRLEFELGIIKDMGFPGYFLICSDFIKWAKDHHIPVGPGRGSGAGSIVAWALKITDLDPLELGLLFERFLNPERVSMPDFDVDFCQSRREEVIKYVQEKYGHDRVAQIITFGKLQARAVVRDVGRVLQMSYGQVDRLAKMIPNNPADPMTLGEALKQDEDLRAARNADETSRKLIDIALKLEGLYRHASTHAAGLVIGERPLHELVPLYRDARSDMPVTQFNMKYVEQAGLVKFDFLGLKTMTVVQRTLDMLKENKELDIDSLQIPLDDEKSYELIARGDTVGVFQLESAGMRDMLRKVKPNRFEDIIALVSLYRPGPMDNIPKYIAIKEGKEEPDYMHPVLQPYLEETYGIMIYQEQVMQAAQELADYTLGGADLLRRAMGKKIQSEMDDQRVMFVEGAAKHHNVAEAQSSEIFDQIAKFAGYGFNKSHAAAYALIAYWTAWLKANYPLEFMAASMTLDLGNTDKLGIFKQDLDKMGIEILIPDVNASRADFIVEGDGIRYALAALKGVGEQAMEMLVAEREKGGAYKSIADFAGRLDNKSMNRRQFEQLACAGAFDSLNNGNRAQMAASSELILRHAQCLNEERESGQVSLFGGCDDGSDNALGLPDLPEPKPWGALELLAREFKAVGFYLSAHPLDSRQAQFETLGVKSVVDVEAALQNKSALRVQMAGVLLKKQEKISQKGNKYAFLHLSDPSGIFEVTLFSDILAASREYLEVGTPLLLSVNVEVREDQIRYTVDKIRPLEEALESKICCIEIHMESAAPALKVKEMLQESGRTSSKITLFIDLDEKRKAKLELPGSYVLNAESRDFLRGVSGIRAVREV